jgi:hypothetical protein
MLREALEMLSRTLPKQLITIPLRCLSLSSTTLSINIFLSSTTLSIFYYCTDAAIAQLQHAHLEAIFKMLAVYYIKGKIELSQETIERIFSFLSLENAVDVADNQRVLLLLLDTLHSRHPSLYNFLADKVLLLAEGVEL